MQACSLAHTDLKNLIYEKWSDGYITDLTFYSQFMYLIKAYDYKTSFTSSFSPLIWNQMGSDNILG